MYKVEQNAGQHCSVKAYGNWRNTLLLLAVMLLPLMSFSQNLLTNPSFENGLAGWSTVGENASVSSDANTGNNAAQMCDNYIALTQVFPTQAGKVYQGSCFSKLLKREAGALLFNIRFLNSNYSPIGNFLPNLENSTTYVESNLDNREAPAGAAFVQIIIEKVNDGFSGRGCIVVDDVVLEEVGGGTTCDLSANVITNECNYNGTPNDPSDDFSSPIIRVINPSSTGTQWRYRLANGTLSSKFNYGTPAAIERALVSVGRQVKIIDAGDPDCTFTLSIASIPSCSGGGTDCPIDIKSVVFPNELSPGQQISVTATLVNNSTTANANNQIAFYRFINGERGTVGASRLSNTFPIPALAPNESRTITFQLSLITPLYLEGLYPVGSFNFGSNLGLAINLNDGQTFGSLPDCIALVTSQAKYPRRDLKVEFVNNKGCYGSDGRVKTDIRISNAGSQTIEAPIIAQINNFNFVRRELPEIIGDGRQGISFIKIDEDLAPGQSVVIQEPLQFPSGFNDDFEFTVEVEEIGSNITDTNASNNGDAITVSQDPNCGGTTGGGKIDIELDFDSADALRRYKTTRCTFTVSNEGENTASGVQVAVPLVAGQVVVSGSSNTVVSKGSYNPYGSQIWNVGNLAPGESATLEISLFFLAADLQLFSEVIAATGSDIDSSPNNGNGTSPREDDEVLLTYGNTPSGKADIKVSFIDGENYNIVGGLTTVLDIRLQNIGQNTSNNYTLRAYLSQDNTLSPDTDTKIGESDELGLAAGANAIRSLNIFVPNLLMSGEYYLIFDAAGSNLIDGNLSNNRVSKLINVSNDNSPCDIEIKVGEKICNNSGTPNDPSDDTYTIKITPIKNSGSPATHFTVNGVAGPFPYGEEVEVGPFIIADRRARIIVTDEFIADASNCSESIEVSAPAPCSSGGGSKVDLSLDITSDNPNVGVYQKANFTFTLTNSGDQASKDILINIPKSAGDFVISGGSTPEVSQGFFNRSLGESAWSIPSLGAGESATLKLNLFFLKKPFVYAEVFEAVGNDPDSTPGNGDGRNANEDDEAVFGGQIGNSCNIILTIYGKQCDDSGTPNDPSDDTFTFKYKATATNGSEGYTVDAFNTGEIITPAFQLYDLEYISPVIPIKDGIYELTVRDQANQTCSTSLDITPPNSCSNGGGGEIDLEIAASPDAAYQQYVHVNVTYTVTNTGTATAENVSVTMTTPAGTANTSFFEASQGDFSLFNAKWTVGKLAAGQSATLTRRFFPLLGDKQPLSGFAQIATASPTDIDSTPGNNGTLEDTAEDDDIVFFIPVANLQTPTDGNLLSQNDGATKLYPTVTNGILNVEIVSLAGSADLRIMNTQGQTLQVLNMDLTTGFNQKTLDVSRLNAGTYFIQIVRADSQETLRFVRTE